MARPSKYDPAFAEKAFDFLAQGYSVTAFAGSIGVSRSTIYKWAEEDEGFSDALKAGQAAAAYWWEHRLRHTAETGEGNATAAIFALKNRAAEDWRETSRTEHTGRDGGPIETKDMTPIEKARRVAFLLASGAQEVDDNG